MPDTVNAWDVMSSTTNVTISNSATFDNTQTVSADCVLIKHDTGVVTFVDRLGNTVKSTDRNALLKLWERLLQEQTPTADYLDNPSVA